KSSLLNALAGSHEVEAHDRLFETLDPTTRRVDLGDGVRALASDTVGFLRNLPPNLIAAFRSTLEEAVQADIIVEVVDASAPEALEQHRASQEILGELEALDKPYVAALNKWDLVEDHQSTWERLKRLPNAVALSATSGMGLEELRECLRELVRNRRTAATIRLPYDHLDLLDMIHQRGHVLSQEYQSDYVEAQIEVDSEILGKLERFVVAES
ncbi:MAG: GTPase HflX, partial [Armatimonadetes bacterium]|nr:GTPase HflX [Armatimonadota bacterium]